MLLVAIFLVIFSLVFFLVNVSYPSAEKGVTDWQQKRMDVITPKLDGMFLDVSLKRLMLIDIISPLLSGLFGFIITRHLWGALGFAVAGLAIPTFVIKRMEINRRKKFANQIVDGLMILSSSLKAGLSLTQSFEVLVEEMPPPIGQEFSLALRQMHMGASLDEAMNNLKKRIRVDELDMVVTAMMVARETGGDITETFSRLVFAIQERNKLVGRVNSLCVQGKLQGIIMSLIPIAFAAFVYKVNPHFFDVFFQDNFGKAILTYAVVSQLIGIILIRKLSKIDI
jgi:tight adherence protein B